MNPESGTSSVHLRRVIIVNVISCILVVMVFWGGFLWMRSGKRPKPLPQPVPVIPDHGESMWHYDDRLGFSHVPAAKGFHKSYNSVAVYTIDETGCRVTPDPVNPKGRVVVLGCSFTFGDGVQDAEAFPYLLGQDHWTEYKVQNRASMAYGTGQAYLVLEEELAREDLPALVLYGYIRLHIDRNYLNKPWLDVLAGCQMDDKKKRGNPHFEIEEGRLVFKGVVGPEAGLSPSVDLREKSIKITLALIAGMQEMCARKGVPFVLVVLPSSDEWDGVVSEVAKQGVLLLDLRHLCREDEFIPGDSHPAAPCHARIANAIATSEEVRGVFPHP